MNRLTKLYDTGKRDSNRCIIWMCQCECGNKKEVSTKNFGRTTFSCGCLNSENVKKRQIKHGHASYRNESITYKSWQMMKNRCLNENYPRFNDHGGRGIMICERWMVFENFLADMGERPSKKYSIDRKDNDGHYEPSNCKWSTMVEQNSNKRVRIDSRK